MGVMHDFSIRSVEKERMDDPHCDPQKLVRTVRQFRLINRLVARYRTILNRWILQDMRGAPEQAYRLVDLGAGGCDIPQWLLTQARRDQLTLDVEGWDNDPRITAYAQTTHDSTAALTIRTADALRTPIAQPVDYLFGNHFLHHLSDDDIVALIRRWAPHVRRYMIFSDLRRGLAPYMGFTALSCFLPP